MPDHKLTAAKIAAVQAALKAEISPLKYGWITIGSIVTDDEYAQLAATAVKAADSAEAAYHKQHGTKP